MDDLNTPLENPIELDDAALDKTQGGRKAGETQKDDITLPPPPPPPPPPPKAW